MRSYRSVDITRGIPYPCINKKPHITIIMEGWFGNLLPDIFKVGRGHCKYQRDVFKKSHFRNEKTQTYQHRPFPAAGSWQFFDEIFWWK